MEMEIVEVALQIMITVTAVAMILVLAVGAVILLWEEKYILTSMMIASQ